MDVLDLFQSCRRGDLEQVVYLVENKELDLNLRDKWDSTPLYYACLCGHLELVKYLLVNGAVCDSSTFDGERCVYGALTDAIRKLLLDHKMLTSITKRREAYTEFLRRLYEDEVSKDVKFNVHGEEVNGHKFMLSTRSSLFRMMFEEKWKYRDVVNLGHRQVTCHAFKLLLEYIYTGQVKVDIRDVHDLNRLAKHCKMSVLQSELDDAFKKADSFVQSKRGAAITTLHLDSNLSQSELQQDLGVLAQQALPLEFRPWNGIELPLMPRVEQTFVDVVFIVDGYEYFCHKPIFSSRSEYFRALLEDHFDESEMDGQYDLPIIQIHHVTPKVFSCVVYFVYTNHCEITEDVVGELLHTADMFLLPGLTKLAGRTLARLVTSDTVIDILRTARLFNLPRLEDQCTEYLADNIEAMSEDVELHKVIAEDARSVRDRQETDSIQIVDDIRSQIRARVRSMSDMAEAEWKMSLVDNLLSQLDMEA